MYALDTNILVYAHNASSPFHVSAKAFVESVMNNRDEFGQLSICIPAQVLLEFVNVITWQRLDTPLPLPIALQVVQDYLDAGVMILYQTPNHLTATLDLLRGVKSRKKIFDVSLIATLKEHGISGLYTVNVKDFEEFVFLDVNNPLG